MYTLYDVAVIGGGINGCGCAADASLRGLKTVLIEKNDFASQTSSKSTKLIHGGLRYLEYFHFKLVKKAIIERQNLLSIAPHIVKPLQIMLPYVPTMRQSWLIRAGLFLYDHLTLKNKLPKSQSIGRDSEPFLFQPLATKLSKGFSFYDASTKDARLTIFNAIQAKNHGAECMPHTEIIKSEVIDGIWVLTLKNNKNNKEFIIKARSVINASGPWVNEVSILLNIKNQRKLSLVKGSHFVVPKLYEGNHAYLLQGEDQRIIFVVPYYGNTMIGTTDIPFNENLDNPQISNEEIDYLCHLCNQYFSKQINKNMIINSWSGVRPLLDNQQDSPQKISRDYVFDFHHHPAPLINIYGGKITTYRKLASSVIDKLETVFSDLPESKTDVTPLPGSTYKNQSFADYVKYANKKYQWLNKTIIQRYLDNYGSHTEIILKNVENNEQLGQHFGHELYEKEVNYLIKYEWVQSAEELLWNRTKLGLNFSELEKETLQAYIESKISL